MTKYNAPQRGSALIVTMLFGTVAVGLSLLLSAFALSDFRQILALDESNTARYANEAMLEDFMLDYDADNWTSLACDANGNKVTDDIYKDVDTNEIKQASTGDRVFPCSFAPFSADNAMQSRRIAHYFATRAYHAQPIGSTYLMKTQNVPDVMSFRFQNFSTIPPLTGNRMIDFSFEFKLEDGSTHPIKQNFTVSLNEQNPSDTLQIPGNIDYIVVSLSGHGQSIPTDTIIKYEIVPGSQTQFMLIDTGKTTFEAITTFGATARKSEIEIERTTASTLNYAIFGRQNVIIN